MSNHLVWAILSSLFCCMPLGIVSIVYAAQVDGKVQAGDIKGAVEYSVKARNWSLASAGLVLGLILVYGFLILLASVAGATRQ